ncbi:MAG: DUF1284 domain-containing protein [Paenibacillaceae bacterium]
MSIRLRGHHLLCLLGYRGMGYSEPFAKNMTGVYEQLWLEPATPVTIVKGSDDLCKSFPCDQPNHCDNHNVHERDEFIRKHLGLEVDDCLAWQQILDRVKSRVKPHHIPEWCATCQWLSYGVCEEGVNRIASGVGLLSPSSLNNKS